MGRVARCVFGYDLGSRWGLAVAQYPDGWMRTYTGSMPREEDPARRLLAFVSEHERLAAEWRPLVIGYEDPGFSVLGAGQTWIRRQEGYLLAWCAQHEVLCVGLHSSSVKRYAFAHGARDPRVGGGALKPGALKRAVCEGAIRRGWVAPGSKQMEDAADAAWVADMLRHHPLLEVER